MNKYKNIVFFSHLYLNNNNLHSNKSFFLKKEVANENYEKKFIELFETLYGSIYLLNYPFYSSKKVLFNPFYVKSSSIQYSNSSGKSVGFFSNSYFRLFLGSRILINQINRHQKLYGNIEIAIFSTYHNSKVIRYLRKNNKNCIIVFLVPDLPIFHYKKLSLIGKLFFRSDNESFIKIFANKEVDIFVPITKYMIEYLNYPFEKSLVIESIVSENDSKQSINVHKKKKSQLAYLGALKADYGVDKLISAFISLNDNYLELVIAGRGELSEYIEKLSYTTPSIKYRGYISKEMTNAIECESTILIVPEVGEKEYSKYSFHSKIFEYMLSGTPVLTYAYPGIPKEYYEHLFLIKNTGNPVEDIKNAIITTLSYGEKILIEKGKNARKFLLENKSLSIFALQMEKMIMSVHSNTID